MTRTFKLSVLAAAVLAAPIAQAYEPGDFILRAGAVTVQPDASSSNVSVGGAELDGWQVDVEDDTQLGITATYMLTDFVGIGVLGATPFKHDIKGDAAISAAGKLAETRHLPPTITFQFFPLAAGSKLQPYAGIGFNYTNFFEEKTTQTLTDAVGAASTDIELDDSFGIAVEAGVDYMLTENIGINAAVWWADIDTEATIGAYDAAGTKVATAKVDVDIDPWVYMVALSYKF